MKHRRNMDGPTREHQSRLARAEGPAPPLTHPTPIFAYSPVPLAERIPPECPPRIRPGNLWKTRLFVNRQSEVGRYREWTIESGCEYVADYFQRYHPSPRSNGNYDFVKRDDAEDIDASCAFPSTAGKYRTHHSWSWDQRLGSSAARNHACGHLAKEGRRFDGNLRVYSPATEYVLHSERLLAKRSHRSCLWCYRMVSRMETRISLAKNIRIVSSARTYYHLKNPSSSLDPDLRGVPPG
jgi:hypothetical protein